MFSRQFTIEKAEDENHFRLFRLYTIAFACWGLPVTQLTERVLVRLNEMAEENSGRDSRFPKKWCCVPRHIRMSIAAFVEQEFHLCIKSFCSCEFCSHSLSDTRANIDVEDYKFLLAVIVISCADWIRQSTTQQLQRILVFCAVSLNEFLSTVFFTVIFGQQRSPFCEAPLFKQSSAPSFLVIPRLWHSLTPSFVCLVSMSASKSHTRHGREMTVSKIADNALVYTNAVYSHSTEIGKISPYVSIKTKAGREYVYSALEHPEAKEGQIILNALQRRNLDVSLGEAVTASRFSYSHCDFLICIFTWSDPVSPITCKWSIFKWIMRTQDKLTGNPTK